MPFHGNKLSQDLICPSLVKLFSRETQLTTTSSFPGSQGHVLQQNKSMQGNMLKCSHLWVVISRRARGPRTMPWERAQQRCGCCRPRETEWCRVGREERCFPGWVLLVFAKAMVHDTLAQGKEMRGREMAVRPPIWGVEEHVYPYFKMYSAPRCTERLFAGQMSHFTILIRTCVVGVAASTPNPRPTRN